MKAEMNRDPIFCCDNHFHSHIRSLLSLMASDDRSVIQTTAIIITVAPLCPSPCPVLSLQWKYNERSEECWYCIFGLSCPQGKLVPTSLVSSENCERAVTQHTAWLNADGNDDRWDLGQRLRECALARASLHIVHFQRSCRGWSCRSYLQEFCKMLVCGLCDVLLVQN